MSQSGFSIYLAKAVPFPVFSALSNGIPHQTRNMEVEPVSWCSLLSIYKRSFPFYQFCPLLLSWMHCLPLFLCCGFGSGCPHLSTGLLQWSPTCLLLLQSILLHTVLVFFLKHRSDHIIPRLNIAQEKYCIRKTGKVHEQTTLQKRKIHIDTREKLLMLTINVTMTFPHLANWQFERTDNEWAQERAEVLLFTALGRTIFWMAFLHVLDMWTNANRLQSLSLNYWIWSNGARKGLKEVK